LALLVSQHQTTASAAVLSPTTDSDQLDLAAPCSLREAVQSANLDSNQGGCVATGTYGAPADTINLLVGHTYLLSATGAEDVNASGDLDVFGNTTGPKDGNLVLNGNGATIDGNGVVTGDRVLDIRPGGAMPALTVSIDGVTITGGKTSTFGAGGGIQTFNSPGSVSISNSTLVGNQAASRGGAIATFGDTTLTNVTVNGNHADSGGGGLMTGAGDTTLHNVTISGNKADADGGGLYAGNGIATLNNVTVTDNKADFDVGGADAGNGGGLSKDVGTVVMRNSIVAGNADLSPAPTLAPDCGPDHLGGAGTFTFTSPNLIGDTTGCVFAGAGNLVNVPAGLDILASNGGPQTHALLAGSPAIDAGDPPSCQPTDERGIARPQGSTCDLGAFELVSADGVVTKPPEATGMRAAALKKCKKKKSKKARRKCKKKANLLPL
jgi:hypothetical protein